MKEIIFKAKAAWYYKHIQKGTVLEGAFTESKYSSPSILIFAEGTEYEIDRDTLVQYTGVNDSNDKKIFEGDQVVIWAEEPISTSSFNTGYDWELFGTVVFVDGSFTVSIEEGLNISLSEILNNVVDIEIEILEPTKEKEK